MLLLLLPLTDLTPHDRSCLGKRTAGTTILLWWETAPCILRGPFPFLLIPSDIGRVFVSNLSPVRIPRIVEGSPVIIRHRSKVSKGRSRVVGFVLQSLLDWRCLWLAHIRRSADLRPLPKLNVGVCIFCVFMLLLLEIIC